MAAQGGAAEIEQAIHQLSALALVSLTGEEAHRLAKDLASVVAYIDTLKNLSLPSERDGEAEAAGVENVLRDDTPEERSKEEVEKVVGAAAQVRDGWIVVRRVLEL